MDNNSKQEYNFTDLIDIFAKLRDPEHGCPWDLKQTHQSLCKYLIEETYELIDAAENNSPKLAEETGDLLLQVMLHSQIAKDQGNFDIQEVINILADKMITRHPHIFGDASVSDADEVKANWDQIKRKQNKTGVLDGVPKAAPSLLESELIGRKTETANFDWDCAADVKNKIAEEVQEFLDAPNPENQAEEFGDLLFSLVQYARKLDYSAETLLKQANQKFRKRFAELEKKVDGDIRDQQQEDLQKIWQEIKQEN